MKELFTFLLLSTMFLCFALETYKVGAVMKKHQFGPVKP